EQYNILEKNMKFNKETKIYLPSSLLLFSYMLTGITTFISDVDLNKVEEIKYENIIKQINENNIQNIVLPSVIFENTADYALRKNIIFKNVQTAYVTGTYVFPKVLEKIRKVFINAQVKWVYGVPGAELISVLDFEEITEEDLESMKKGKGLLAGKKVNEMESEIKKPEKEISEESNGENLKSIDRENEADKSTEEIGEIWVRRDYILKENSDTDENKKWYGTGNSGYINNKGQLVLLGKVGKEINIKGKKYYPLAVETAFSFCKAVRKSALISKDGNLYLVFERNPEFKGSPETDGEMEKLKEKFGIFKIIEGNVYVNKNFNSETDYKKTEETVEKV
ncbi:MAG: peptide synthase, partial [Leptotrichiaceae bacterium]|nr:peptide synthase [Leptotrichiaceae bacterium]